MKLVGRQAERQNIHSALTSPDPELVAIWGRRRVGKSVLLRDQRRPLNEHHLAITGQRNAPRKTQLAHFADALSIAFPRGAPVPVPDTWDAALKLLADSIESIPADGKPIAVFLDEAPWLDTRRSGFLDALEYFWDTTGSKNERLKVFVCGSAAPWIIRKIANGTGGWHRRVTRRIRVLPFTLEEAAQYLASRNVQLSKLDVLKLHMVLGGVPYYLSLMRRGESLATFVDRLFFAQPPDLGREFDEAFDSLLDNSSTHKKIVSCLARSKPGLTRKHLTQTAALPSGGSLSRYIEDLAQSGFIEAHSPLGTTAERDKRYRVVDLLTLFHLSWLSTQTRASSWQAITASPRYKSWCSHAFEMLAWSHSRSLAQALGIARSDYNLTRADLDHNGEKLGIDLLVDVRGGSAYLLELKFSDEPYVLTAEEASILKHKRQLLERACKGSRSIIVCLLTPCGAQHNTHKRDAVDLVLDCDALFRRSFT